MSKSIERVRDAVEIFNPDIFFIAGGTYIIPGKFHEVNKFIAQPEVDSIFPSSGLEFSYALPERRIKIRKEHSEAYFDYLDPLLGAKTKNKLESIKLHSSDRYEYDSFGNIETPMIENIFQNALANYEDMCVRRSVKIDTAISFFVYDSLIVDQDGVIKGSPNCILDVVSSRDDRLEIHIDSKALVGCLLGRLKFNGVQSLCFYRRIPNVHKPNDLFSLNFLVADRSVRDDLMYLFEV